MDRTPPSPESPVLARDTIARAQSRATDSVGPVEKGCRRIAFQLLSPPTSASSRSTSSTSTVSSNRDIRHILVPEVLVSSESYQFVGFNQDTANELFKRWRMVKPQNQSDIGFVGFAQNYISEFTAGIVDDEDNWTAAMTRVGIHGGIKSALMHEKHRQIRLSMPLREWLHTIIDTNFRTLEHLNSNVQSHLQAHKAEPSLRGGQGEPETEPVLPENHIVLYKTLPYLAFKEAFTADGAVHLGKIASERPTDFATRGGLYLTPQKWVAMFYADALNDTCICADVRTLAIHVPQEHINSLKIWNLEFGDRWRELIWHSRRGEYYPSDWAKDYSRQELVTGPITHSPNQHYSKMKSWEKVGMENVIMSKDGNEMSSQYVFMKTGVIQDLQKKVMGKSYLLKTYGDFKVIASPWADQSASGV